MTINNTSIQSQTFYTDTVYIINIHKIKSILSKKRHGLNEQPMTGTNRYNYVLEIDNDTIK